MALAAELHVWVVLGSAHRLGDGHKPHNSLYVIDDRGRLVDRYDKRFCSGDPDGTTGDLAHYTPGDHPTIWEVDGVRCGALVCYDVRFPACTVKPRRHGVELILHSFHAGNVRPERATPSARRSAPTYRRSTRRPVHPSRDRHAGVGRGVRREPRLDQRVELIGGREPVPLFVVLPTVSAWPASSATCRACSSPRSTPRLTCTTRRERGETRRWRGRSTAARPCRPLGRPTGGPSDEPGPQSRGPRSGRRISSGGGEARWAAETVDEAGVVITTMALGDLGTGKVCGEARQGWIDPWSVLALTMCSRAASS